MSAAPVHIPVHCPTMGQTVPSTERDQKYRNLVAKFLTDIMASRKITTQGDLGKLLHVNRTTAGRYLKAEVQAPLEVLLRLQATVGVSVPQQIVDAFNAIAGVPAAPLAPAMNDDGPLSPDGITMPVISSVAAGRLTDPDTQITGEYQTITIGGLEPGDYFATVVDGTSMNRISPPGSTIVVNRRDTELVRGRRYIFARRGKTTYKKWETDPPRLEPETTDPDENPTIYPKSEDEWLVIGRVRLTMLRDL